VLGINPTTRGDALVRTHRSIRRRYVAAVLASLAAAVGGPAAALAAPQYPRPVPPTSGVTPSDFVKPLPRIGDTPAEFGQPVAPAPKVGDTPADFPGASRAARSTQPSTITVVRPERTVVRDTDPVLPMILASLALLVALGIAGTGLVRMRSMRLGRAG
jgi:hypothetical protein